MTIWLILTLMAAAAAAYVAAPFLWPIDPGAAAQSSELGVFRDQLAEIDREEKAGMIEPSAAGHARIEIKRRMLAADKRTAGAAAAQPLTALEHRFVLLSVLGVVVLGSALLYAFTGNPGLRSAVRMQPVPDKPAAASTEPTSSGLDSMIGKLTERLKTKPDDAKGWAMLGWAYSSTSQFAQSAEAYRKAAGLEPKSAAFRTGFADALVQAADGKVTPEAATVIDQALAIDAKDPRGRFLKGLARQQSGDAKGAIEDWISVLTDAKSGDQWAPELRAQIIEAAKAAHIDVSGRLPVAAAPVTGPSAADIAAAQDMTPADRLAMVNSMVEQLAARLASTPRNAQGWIQLMRARKVLGDADAAKAALTKGLAVFADAPAEQARLTAAATELGIAQ